MGFSYFEREFHDTFFQLSPFLYHFVFLVFKRGVPPAEQPFIVEDMPQMHRFVYDYYSHYVESLRAQREVRLTVKRITSVLGPVYTMPEEFENGGFNLKTRQVFFVLTTPKEYRNATINFEFVSEENVANEMA